MNDFLKNLRDSVDTGKVNQGAVDKLNEINEINKLVNEKYGEEKIGEKMSQYDLSILEQKVDDLVGERKDGVNKEMLEYLEALKENVIVNAEINIVDNMYKVMSEINEDYYISIISLTLNKFGIEEKEIEDIEFDETQLSEANNILSKICLFEVEYSDYLEDNTFYLEVMTTIKKELIKILKIN